MSESLIINMYSIDDLKIVISNVNNLKISKKILKQLYLIIMPCFYFDKESLNWNEVYENFNKYQSSVIGGFKFAFILNELVKYEKLIKEVCDIMKFYLENFYLHTRINFYACDALGISFMDLLVTNDLNLYERNFAKIFTTLDGSNIYEIEISNEHKNHWKKINEVVNNIKNRNKK